MEQKRKQQLNKCLVFLKNKELIYKDIIRIIEQQKSETKITHRFMGHLFNKGIVTYKQLERCNNAVCSEYEALRFIDSSCKNIENIINTIETKLNQLEREE